MLPRNRLILFLEAEAQIYRHHGELCEWGWGLRKCPGAHCAEHRGLAQDDGVDPGCTGSVRRLCSYQVYLHQPKIFTEGLSQCYTQMCITDRVNTE